MKYIICINILVSHSTQKKSNTINNAKLTKMAISDVFKYVFSGLLKQIIEKQRQRENKPVCVHEHVPVSSDHCRTWGIVH